MKKVLSFFLSLCLFFSPLVWLVWLVKDPEKALSFLIWTVLIVYMIVPLLFWLFLCWLFYLILKKALS